MLTFNVVLGYQGLLFRDFLWFFFSFFFQSDRPTQLQETHSTVNEEEKGDGLAAKSEEKWMFSQARDWHIYIYFFTKNEKSKDYCKADLKQRVLFFATIFRLAITAFFRFTDVTGNRLLFKWIQFFTTFWSLKKLGNSRSILISTAYVAWFRTI